MGKFNNGDIIRRKKPYLFERAYIFTETTDPNWFRLTCLFDHDVQEDVFFSSLNHYKKVWSCAMLEKFKYKLWGIRTKIREMIAIL